MSNYKQQDGAFSKWIRSGFVMISNAFGKPPVITYAEQEVSILDGGEPQVTRLGGIRKDFNPAFQFPIYDSLTGEIKGTATELDFYEIGAAHYLATAALRDAGDPAVMAVAYPRMFPTVTINQAPPA
jgi:hypothetical protein